MDCNQFFTKGKEQLKKYDGRKCVQPVLQVYVHPTRDGDNTSLSIILQFTVGEDHPIRTRPLIDTIAKL